MFVWKIKLKKMGKMLKSSFVYSMPVKAINLCIDFAIPSLLSSPSQAAVLHYKTLNPKKWHLGLSKCHSQLGREDIIFIYFLGLNTCAQMHIIRMNR